MSTSCDTSQSRHDTSKLIDTSRPVHLFDLIEDRQEGEERTREKKRKRYWEEKKKDNGREPGNPTWYQDGRRKKDPVRKEKDGEERKKQEGRKKEEFKNKCLNKQRTFHKHFSGRKKKRISPD